jgi:hypothetical protein
MADTVDTTLFYFVPPEDGSIPYNKIPTNPKISAFERNYSLEEHTMQVENVRGKEDSVTLDTAGFQFFQAPSKHKAFDNDEDIQNEYYPECIEYIKKFTGASRVVLFDHSEYLYLTGGQRTVLTSSFSFAFSRPSTPT